MSQVQDAASSGAVQFFSIELTPLSDGHVFVGIRATLCEPVCEGFELIGIDMAHERVPSFEAALDVIRDAARL